MNHTFNSTKNSQPKQLLTRGQDWNQTFWPPTVCHLWRFAPKKYGRTCLGTPPASNHVNKIKESREQWQWNVSFNPVADLGLVAWGVGAAKISRGRPNSSTAYGRSGDRRRLSLRRGTTRLMGRIQSKCPILWGCLWLNFVVFFLLHVFCFNFFEFFVFKFLF